MNSPVRPLFLLAFILLVACGQQNVNAPPLPDDATILAFGDSVTYGTGKGRGESYPTILARKTGMNVVNGGVRGDTAANAKNRIADQLETHTPDLVILELGGNDFLAKRRPPQVKADLRSIIKTIQYRGVPVVLVAVPEFSVLRATTGTLKDSPIYRELGDELGIVVVDKLFADILSDATLRSDPIHPNALGYSKLADGILKSLAQAGYIEKSHDGA